jgi:medium-chain acyl-[acyl-carrier-protein] hydrolase
MKAILFHHVGGDHYAFRNVQNWLLPEIESFAYELPGRADRYREPLLNNMDVMIEDAYRQTKPHMEEPFFFIGLSLGGLIAYHFSHYLKEHKLPLPSHLFIASRKCPESFFNQPLSSTLPGPEFWEYVSKFGGCPPLLLEHQELREFYEPILRADFALAEDYIEKFESKDALDIPAWIYYGEKDGRNLVETDATGWKPYFNNDFECKHFPGGHFFLYEEPDAVRHIKQILLHGS